MKILPLAICSALACAIAPAQQTFPLEIVGDSDNHMLTFPTQQNFNYQIFMSPDLETFMDTGIVEPGDGSLTQYGFMTDADKLFYRIEEVPDPYNGGFLTLPTQDDVVDILDGVRFAFDLDVLPALPAKIRIYQRVFDSGDPFEQIGSLIDFVTLDGVRTLRGSAVWIADEVGEYEVQAAALDDTGAVIASATRRVEVEVTEAPTVEILPGSPSPPVTSATRQPAEFKTNVTGDVTRVEFYDNGVLIGSDQVAPFGDQIQDIEERGFDLLRGTHNITAKAFDSNGRVGETVSPFQVTITGGNARPTLTIDSPSDGFPVVQGQNLTIAYTEGDPDGASDLAFVEAEDFGSGDSAFDESTPFTDLIFDTTGWEPGSHRIKVETLDNNGDENYPAYVVVEIQTPASQQLATDLVKNIVDEDSAEPSEEVFFGILASSQEITGGLDSGLQMDKGIVLTSGSSSDWNAGDDAAPVGNYDEESTTTFWDAPGDRQLELRAAGEITNDAAILEFKVDCEYSQLQFEFQFGSEEYIEFVFDEAASNCYNDAFLVLVDDVAVSLTPDAQDIVAVNSIHPFIDEDDSSGCLDADLAALREHLYIDDDEIDAAVSPSNQPIQVEYDGMTVKLKGHVFVTPGVHRIKIVIGDLIDTDYDSGLFIEKGSVRTVNPSP